MRRARGALAWKACSTATPSPVVSSLRLAVLSSTGKTLSFLCQESSDRSQCSSRLSWDGETELSRREERRRRGRRGEEEEKEGVRRSWIHRTCPHSWKTFHACIFHQEVRYPPLGGRLPLSEVNNSLHKCSLCMWTHIGSCFLHIVPLLIGFCK